MLSGLGKYTKRGVKKCPKCGTFNGNRSNSCKNKNCNVPLKGMEEKLKNDAVKLLTGTEKQIYSIKVKDVGLDTRGFVQLPLFNEVALCFVNSCQNSFDNSILKCHEENCIGNPLICNHIKSALKSNTVAVQLIFNNDVLNTLKIDDDFKKKLYLTATEKEGCFVQRVSKSVMAIKCQVTPKHPLGYLHFNFVKAKGKEFYEKFHCSCLEHTVRMPKDKIKCIHYYACIWALCSDKSYRDEFIYFIQKNEFVTESIARSVESIAQPRCLPKSKQTGNKSQIKSKMAQKVAEKSNQKLKKCKQIVPKVLPIEVKILNEITNGTSWNFIDWLSFVTESINDTMKFENSGIVNNLSFHTPVLFYECFRNRIPSIYEPIHNDTTTTYSIMNILHLKQIFDTSQVKLTIAKKFVNNKSGGYIEYNDNTSNFDESFIFFINVGQLTVDESDNMNNSFGIEWNLPLKSITKVEF